MDGLFLCAHNIETQFFPVQLTPLQSIFNFSFLWRDLRIRSMMAVSNGNKGGEVAKCFYSIQPERLPWIHHVFQLLGFVSQFNDTAWFLEHKWTFYSIIFGYFLYYFTVHPPCNNRWSNVHWFIKSERFIWLFSWRLWSLNVSDAFSLVFS